MEFACISSGSSGNSAVVRYAESALLIDCGLTLKQTLFRLDKLDLQPSKLIGIIVTHEHSDHSSGVARIARRFNLPVWMTHGTHRRTRDTRIADLRYFYAEQKFAVGPFEIHPFAVPHDAAEACQFVISHGTQKLAILTDIGMITPHVIAGMNRYTPANCRARITMNISRPCPNTSKGLLMSS